MVRSGSPDTRTPCSVRGRACPTPAGEVAQRHRLEPVRRPGRRRGRSAARPSRTRRKRAPRRSERPGVPRPRPDGDAVGSTISTRLSATRSISPTRPIVGFAPGQRAEGPLAGRRSRRPGRSRRSPGAGGGQCVDHRLGLGDRHVDDDLVHRRGRHRLQRPGVGQAERGGEGVAHAGVRVVGVGVADVQRRAGPDQVVNRPGPWAWSPRRCSPLAATAGDASPAGRSRPRSPRRRPPASDPPRTGSAGPAHARSPVTSPTASQLSAQDGSYNRSSTPTTSPAVGIHTPILPHANSWCRWVQPRSRTHLAARESVASAVPAVRSSQAVVSDGSLSPSRGQLDRTTARRGARWGRRRSW